MTVRRLAAAVFMGSLAVLTGCPFGELDGLFPSDTIQDGSFSGDVTWTSEMREAGELYWDNSGSEVRSDRFSAGALVKPTGAWLEVDDRDSLSFGAIEIARTVDSVDYGDWGYEVVYDLDAQWSDVELTGTQWVTYWILPDGCLEMYDTIELCSCDTDGVWEYVYEEEGILEPDSGGDAGEPFNPLNHPLLDKKSG
jgi:hypothetical protein